MKQSDVTVGQAVDVLMITYNRPEYTRLALTRLLSTCDEQVRVWIWHNGQHSPTLEAVRSLSQHPRVHAFHHSAENQRLAGPTNWLWRNATGDFLSKVDDDCLMPEGWVQTLRETHRDVPDLGVVGCWRFFDEDFDATLAGRKIVQLPGGHRLLKNLWVEGSGYLMKRQCVEQQGLLAPKQSFTNYCIQLAARGWINGWYYPFLLQEHMDDPRSPHSLLRSDEDLQRYLPLSAERNGVTSLSAWQAQLRRSARSVQAAPYEPWRYLGWRRRINGIRSRLRRFLGAKAQW